MEELKLTEGFWSFSIFNELSFGTDEHKVEYQIWRDFTTRLTPEFYTGFIDMLKAFRDAGGLVIVVSHSEEDQIKRHYAAAGFIPDSVYGWSTDPQKTKPNPWPVLDLCSNFNVKPEEVCVLDDLMPGIVMAKASGAYAAGACWGHNIPLIREDMKKSCDALFNEVPLFHKFLLSQ